MRAEKLRTSLLAGALSFCIAFGGVACLVTAFGFEKIELGTVALWCGLLSVLLAVCFALDAGWLPLPLLALALIFFWYSGQLMLSVESLVFHISLFYHKAYGWNYARWSDQIMSQGDMLLALCLVCAVVGCLICEMICRRKAGWLAVPVSAMPLGSCLVVTDTVPDTWCLGLYFGAMALLLITHTVRRQDHRRADRLTAVLLIPVALAVAALFLVSPRETYNGQSRAELWGQYFVDRWNYIVSGTPLTSGDIPGPYPGEAGQTLNLEAAGPKINRYAPVMDVIAAEDGSLYLRGRAYDVYDGKGWSASDQDWAFDDPENWDSSGDILGNVTVTTRNFHSVRYLPYNVPADDPNRAMHQGRLENPENLLEYTFTQVEAPTLDTLTDFSGESADESLIIPQNPGTAANQYRLLPDQTRERAVRFMIENIPLYAQYLEYLAYTAQSYLSSVSHQSGGVYISGIYVEVPRDESGALIKPENYDHFASMTEPERDLALIRAIADHVSTSARYSLNTPRMPEGEEDFALWFLEYSDTGYCVHYATAAAVLLRAAGFNARYVTGYMIDGREGRSVTVREKDAHAWVEVYLEGPGWVMAEVTAGIAETAPNPTEGSDDPTEPATTPETGPPETTRPDPSVPTEPQATQPSGGKKEPLDLARLWQLLKWMGILAVTAGLILGQRRLRLRLRHRRFTRGTPNAQALARWREVERLCRLLEAEPDERLVALARKAKFSQHSLTEEELSCLDKALEDLRDRLRLRPWPYRLWYALARAAY